MALEVLDAPVCVGGVLAVPLHSAGRRVRMTAREGEVVRRNETLAVSESDDGANVCAPVCGTVLGMETRRLAAPVAVESECVLLRVEGGGDSVVLSTDDSPRELLKAGGVAGLGGAGFPAWRKWRDGAKLFIVNAAESDGAISCDAALRAETGGEFVKAVGRVAKILGAEKTVVAVPDDDSDFNSVSDSGSDDGVQFFSVPRGDLAAGSERLLIRAVAGMDVVPPNIAADFGMVCFNAATVAAADAALSHGIPLTRRIVTVRGGDSRLNVRAPFGMALSELAEVAGASVDLAEGGGAGAGGRRMRELCPLDAVVCAATNAVDFSASAAPSETFAPCIRCGACVPACPVGLNPMRMHFLSLDSREDDLRLENISHCLECARCDDVCPSGIPLARAFGAARDVVLEGERNRFRAAELRERHERHNRAMRKKTAPRPADESAKSAALESALRRAAANDS